MRSRRVVRALAGDGRDFGLAPFGENRLPVLDQLRRPAMDLQPRQRLAEDAAVGERALRFRACRQVAQPPLQADDQPQALDVAARERQLAEARPRQALRLPVRSAVNLIGTTFVGC